MPQLRLSCSGRSSCHRTAPGRRACPVRPSCRAARQLLVRHASKAKDEGGAQRRVRRSSCTSARRAWSCSTIRLAVACGRRTQRTSSAGRLGSTALLPLALTSARARCWPARRPHPPRLYSGFSQTSEEDAQGSRCFCTYTHTRDCSSCSRRTTRRVTLARAGPPPDESSFHSYPLLS